MGEHKTEPASRDIFWHVFWGVILAALAALSVSVVIDSPLTRVRSFFVLLAICATAGSLRCLFPNVSERLWKATGFKLSLSRALWGLALALFATAWFMGAVEPSPDENPYVFVLVGICSAIGSFLCFFPNAFVWLYLTFIVGLVGAGIVWVIFEAPIPAAIIVGALIIVAAILFLFFWYRESRPQSKIKHFEEKAESFLSSYRSQSNVMFGNDQLPEDVLLMQDFYIRLKEQNRHSPQETAKRAEDWMWYVVNKSQAQLKSYLDLDDDGSLSTEEDRQHRVEEMKECIAIAEEIENRFARLLGLTAEKRLAELREKQEKKAQEIWNDD